MGAGRCIHCLKYSDDVTEDHVFPKSWYPTSTPPNLEKWTAPACQKCNTKLGYMENELMITMGFCVNPFDIRAQGIYERARNALKESQGRNERDRGFRKGKFLKFIKNLLYIKPTSQGIHPDFGPHPIQQKHDQLPSVLLSAEFLKRVGDKITRGLYYVLMNRYVDIKYVVEVLPPTHDPSGYDILLEKHGLRIDRGPGFEILRASVSDDPLSFICKVTIWGKLRFRSTIMKREGILKRVLRIFWK